MGVPYVIRSGPYGYWSAVRPYRARKRTVFIIEMALLSFLLLFVLGDIILLFAEDYRYIDEGLYVQCYSVLTGLAILLCLSALRYYRHHLALSIADDPVYRTFIVSSPEEMMKVVDAALGALHIEKRRMDPPARAYTNARRFPKHVRGMFRTSGPDLAIVVYAGKARADGSYKSDVVVGPVTEDNLPEVTKLLQAIDERRTVGRPDLNINWG
jgi:hypothetical protein